MIGAIIGDIIGSVYEWDNIRTKDFPLWKETCRFTDDTVMTCAVYQALKKYLEGEKQEALPDLLVKEMKTLGRCYPHCGYGQRFAKWLFSDERTPYYSFGNGAAMRVSAAGFLAESRQEAMEYAAASARVTHDHPEGVKGAVAVALGIFLGREGKSRQQIRKALSAYYPLDFTLDEIRGSYDFDVSCQGSVPQAITAFLEAEDFEDAIRGAISIGGDSDTIAAIAGSLAQSCFGVPETMRTRALSYLDDRLKAIVLEAAQWE